MNKKNKLTCISLFTGCGGFDIGLEAAGFNVVVATDIDEVCAASYKINYPETPYIVRPIGQVSTKELLDVAKVKKGEIDLLAGGPPCPAFSKSRFYRTDKPRALDDPVAKETVGGYLRILDEARPRAFVLENVRGLAYGVHKEALEHILETAKLLGYKTKWQIINAADYGVPQIRERCIVWGSLSGEVDSVLPTHAKEPDLASPLPKWINAGAVLNDLDTVENEDDEGHFAGGKHHSHLRKIPPGENYLFFTEERLHPEPIFKWRSRYWSFLLKLSPDMPSWTIQARRSNNMGPFHWKNRILRIEEIKRLQTFPDDYHLAGSVEKKWRQIGNAVPPLLGCRIGEMLARHLTEGERT